MGERRDVCRRRSGCTTLKGRKKKWNGVVQLPTRIGQIMPMHADPTGSLTDQLEAEAEAMFVETETVGGVVEGFVKGWFQRKIHESDVRQQWQMEQYHRVIVGVNEFVPRMATRSTCGIRLTMRTWFRQGRPTCGGRLQSYMVSGTLRIRIRQIHRLCVTARTSDSSGS